MLLSVDPGVTGTGLAVWSATGRLAGFTTIYPYRRNEWFPKALQILTELQVYISQTCPVSLSRAIIEYPMFMRGSSGYMVAESGDLCKLAVLTGMIISTLATHYNIKVRIVTPTEWKGQLPKSATLLRVKSILKNEFPRRRLSDHAIDAMGIGLWEQGRFI